MFVQDILPTRNLLAGGELAPGALGDKAVEHVVVPGLITGTKRRRALVPWRLQVFPDLGFFFDYVSVGIDGSELAHEFSPFLLSAM